MSKLGYIYIMCVAVAMMVASCTKISDNQLPQVPVNINLSKAGYWQTYGVVAPGSYRMFVKNERIPSNYPYNANTYTGYGGVLLVCDIYTANPMAYDLSCPVERRPDVRVSIDGNSYDAVCGSCGSHYDVMGGWGTPLSGKAFTQKVGMNRYNVVKTGSGYNIVN
ncbi:MAG: hypothetical protein IIU72_09070 [Muribaculaceae bacterium]|nr:hypothetical protein [Muribaculaceae bacterium]